LKPRSESIPVLFWTFCIVVSVTLDLTFVT
jgi:hypothetical protein